MEDVYRNWKMSNLFFPHFSLPNKKNAIVAAERRQLAGREDVGDGGGAAAAALVDDHHLEDVLNAH